MDKAKIEVEVRRTTDAMRKTIAAEMKDMLGRQAELEAAGITPLDVVGTALSYVLGIYAAGIQAGCGVDRRVVVAAVANAAERISVTLDLDVLRRASAAASAWLCLDCEYEWRSLAAEACPKCGCGFVKLVYRPASEN